MTDRANYKEETPICPSSMRSTSGGDGAGENSGAGSGSIDEWQKMSPAGSVRRGE
jgi:hypothetical protein